MRGASIAYILGAVCLAAWPAQAAPDIQPTSLMVAMSDSLKSPDEDSVTITLSFIVRNGTTKAQDAWITTQMSVDGNLKMNGGVDSGQTLPVNTPLTYRIGSWIPKKPFSIMAYFDPFSVSGELPADAANNLIVRRFDFHPKVRKDTVYTAKNCVPAGGNP